MTKAPRLTGKQVITALQKAGFEVLRIKGSHHFVQHPDGRCTVVPVHAGEVVGIGLLTKILHDTELSVQQFRKLL
jgi:predicted RNA binding protein YcfA (HicA-like mRNA interferase family)